MKKLLLLLSLLLIAAITTMSVASPTKSVADRARQSVVSLQLEYPPDSGRMIPFCTGVAVGRHTILTAQHCLDAAEEMGMKVYYDGAWCVADKVAAYDGVDSVLVHTCREWEHPAAFKPYPPSDYSRAFQFGNVMGLPLVYREGYLVGRFPLPYGHWDEFAGEMVWAWDMNSGPGDSGSAVFNENGEVLCVDSLGIEHQERRFGVMACFAPQFTQEQMAKIR